MDKAGVKEMAIEVEKKYRLNADQFAELARELAEAGADFVGEDLEENIIFTSELLTGSGSVIRLRKTPERSTLTFKKRLEDVSEAKHQIEIESEVANADAITEILAQLHVLPRLVYEKRRKTYTLKSAEIVLDELPFGLFAEIEGTLLSIKEAEMILGMEEFETVQETYPRLTERLGLPRNGIIEARFTR